MEALLLLLRLTPMLMMMIMAVVNAEQAQTKSIHDILKEKGLPAGLVPKCVSNYSFSPDNGLLQVNLHKPCYAKFEALETVYFDKTIKGNLSFGQLAGVNGVEQQELFLWFPVRDIRVDIPNSGFIYFDVGVVYKQVSLSLFESPPDCDTTPDSHSFISLPEYASQMAPKRGQQEGLAQGVIKQPRRGEGQVSAEQHAEQEEQSFSIHQEDPATVQSRQAKGGAAATSEQGRYLTLT